MHPHRKRSRVRVESLAHPSDEPTNNQPFGVRLLGGLLEAGVLLLIFSSPWGFAGELPFFEMLGYATIALLLLLWGLRVVVEGNFTWKRCPVILTLAALFLLGAGQILSLPRPILTALSPSTSKTYETLLPKEGEILLGESAADPSFERSGTTLSLNPSATRHTLLRLLAAFCLFAVVRNNIRAPGAFRRLCWVGLLTGFAISFFGLIQYFSSPLGMIYWTYPTKGVVFGPFVNRNHFAFHGNLCLGLGMGLFLARSRSRRSLGLLQDGQQLGILLALAFMSGSLITCMSRGGILAAFAGLLVCTLFILMGSSTRSFATGAVIIIATALVLVFWIGHERIQARWAPLLTGEAVEEARFAMWLRVLPVAADFPIFGTGYGTFPWVELPRRDPVTGISGVWDHAHNDYLEALIEGGISRLGLSVLALGLVAWLGSRALIRHSKESVGMLAMGGLYGLTTLAVHSFFDFGLQSPAVAVLFTVLAAHLCHAGSMVHPSRVRESGSPRNLEFTLPMGRLGASLGAVTLSLLAVILFGEGMRLYRVDRCQQAALFVGDDADLESCQRQIAFLEMALTLAPEDVLLHERMTGAHEAAADSLHHQRRLLALASLVATPEGRPWGIPSTLIGAAAGTPGDGPPLYESQRIQAHRIEATRHALRARNACPLQAGPHVSLPRHPTAFAKTEPASTSLRRARHLRPWDAEVRFLTGAQEFLEGNHEAAWKEWRDSLTLSPRRLPDILNRCVRVLTPEEILQKVLPDQPGLLIDAAKVLYPSQPAHEGRTYYLRALEHLTRTHGVRSAKDYHLRGSVERDLGRFEEAQASYRLALVYDPDQPDWRVELAEILRQLGQRAEARRELLSVLREQPGHREAVRLLETVTRELVQGR